MTRKLILILLLCIGFQNIGRAVTIRDTVKNNLQPYSDTSCVGTQLAFNAVQSNDTFSHTTYQWFANNVFTGVTLDTFRTTALADGDSVYVILHFTNSLGFADVDTSNVIYVYHDTLILPKAYISILTGSNPDCAGSPVKFAVYPKNGGTAPLYQWNINGVPVPGATNITYTKIFGGTDTVSCQMISNSACSGGPLNDTVISNKVPIIHWHLIAGVSDTNTANPICSGGPDTFRAFLVNPGSAYTLSWYVSGKFIPGAIGTVYPTDTLHNGDIVICVLHSLDSCISNDTANSSPIVMTVIPDKNSMSFLTLIGGANPGCLDSSVKFKGTFSNFGTAPIYEWLVNGVPILVGDSILDTTFLNGDILTFKVKETDNGCYVNDSFSSTSFLMLRDSTPAIPLVSLIGNLLVANKGGAYTWFDSLTYPNPIPGATGQTYHPKTLGYYWALKDTADNACQSLPSNLIFISLLKVNDIYADPVKIYPNPTSGILNMDWGNTNVNKKLDVYSIVGQGLLHDEIINQSHHAIDLSYLPEGSYIVVLRNEDGSTETYKIYLNK
jgi:hypothetical protein